MVCCAWFWHVHGLSVLSNLHLCDVSFYEPAAGRCFHAEGLPIVLSVLCIAGRPSFRFLHSRFWVELLHGYDPNSSQRLCRHMFTNLLASQASSNLVANDLQRPCHGARVHQGYTRALSQPALPVLCKLIKKLDLCCPNCLIFVAFGSNVKPSLIRKGKSNRA